MITLDELESDLQAGRVSLSELLALRLAIGAPFTYHPLGFVTCVLMRDKSRKVRLHYWPIGGGIQQSPDCQLHDHRFEFKSWVLAGSVENVEYDISVDGAQFAVYQAHYRGETSLLVKTSEKVGLVEVSRNRYQAGSSYTVQAGSIHETVRVGTVPAFTVLVTNDLSIADPIVLGSVEGEEKYVYERKKLTERELNILLSQISK